MCPLDELWEIIDHIVLHLLCLLPRLSSQSSHVHKQNNQTNRETVLCVWTNYSYRLIGTSFLTLIYPSYLTYEIIFLTVGTWSLIPHSLWSMPSGRAFFQKKTQPTWIHQCTVEMPRFVLPNTLCIFSSFISWRHPAKTAGFCHSASLNVFIFTPNVRRVEIFWLRKTDSCSSTVHSILPSLKKKNIYTHIPWWYGKDI